MVVIVLGRMEGIAISHELVEDEVRIDFANLDKTIFGKLIEYQSFLIVKRKVVTFKGKFQIRNHRRDEKMSRNVKWDLR